LGLSELRKKIAIIPQDPVLFQGSVRSNLDPFEAATDAQVWTALEQSYMRDAVEDMGGLSAMVEEEGSNFSVGQRQLLCMARALLRQAKIIVLDEATASVDQETDKLLQIGFRKYFADCTQLAIAHRLHTIMDADKILVMDRGVAAQFDSPLNLLNKRRGLFYELVRATGRQTARLLRAIAEGRVSVIDGLNSQDLGDVSPPPVVVAQEDVDVQVWEGVDPPSDVGGIVSGLSESSDGRFSDYAYDSEYDE